MKINKDIAKKMTRDMFKKYHTGDICYFRKLEDIIASSDYNDKFEVIVNDAGHLKDKPRIQIRYKDKSKSDAWFSVAYEKRYKEIFEGRRCKVEITDDSQKDNLAPLYCSIDDKSTLWVNYMFLEQK